MVHLKVVQMAAQMALRTVVQMVVQMAQQWVFLTVDRWVVQKVGQKEFQRDRLTVVPMVVY